MLPKFKSLIFLVISLSITACSDHNNTPQLYQFEETNRLVAFVEEAADLVRKKGNEAFDEFKEEGSKWFSGNRYLFVYDLNGVCVFHQVSPELTGKNIINQKDLNGKPMIRNLVEVASNTAHPCGWVHYLWMEPREIFPVWKSSYIVRAETPDGNVYAVGSGNYYQKPENVFISDLVDSACQLLKEKGLDVIPVFLDKADKYYFNDYHIFILDDLGNAVVDPSFPSLTSRNLLQLKDVRGKYFVQEMIGKLKDQDFAWLPYMAKTTSQSKPAKKLAYIRKVIIDDKKYIVGSSFFILKPIWMKI